MVFLEVEKGEAATPSKMSDVVFVHWTRYLNMNLSVFQLIFYLEFFKKNPGTDVREYVTGPTLSLQLQWAKHINGMSMMLIETLCYVNDTCTRDARSV